MINPTDNITASFVDGAGIFPATLLMAFRTVLLTLTFIWAVWAIIGTLQAAHAPDFTFATLILRLLAILTLVMCCIALVTTVPHQIY